MNLSTKASKKIAAALFCMAGPMLWGSVADLEALQAQAPAIAYQYTFEGGTEAEQLAQKVGAHAPALKQAAPEPRRIARMLTPGYDGSTRCAVLTAFASGAKGDALHTVAPILLAREGTIEFLVRPAAMNCENVMIGGEPSGTNGRWRFLSYDGKTASLAIGSNLSHVLFGQGSGVPYHVGDWYYVAITWAVANGRATINAWVANLSAETPKLLQTITNVGGEFDGKGETPLFLGGEKGGKKFAGGGLDALALYTTALKQTTIAAHYDSIFR